MVPQLTLWMAVTVAFGLLAAIPAAALVRARGTGRAVADVEGDSRL